MGRTILKPEDYKHDSLRIPAGHPLFENLPADKQERIDYLRGLSEHDQRSIRVEALGRLSMEFAPRPLTEAELLWAKSVADSYFAEAPGYVPPKNEKGSANE